MVNLIVKEVGARFNPPAHVVELVNSWRSEKNEIHDMRIYYEKKDIHTICVSVEINGIKKKGNVIITCKVDIICFNMNIAFQQEGCTLNLKNLEKQIPLSVLQNLIIINFPTNWLWLLPQNK